MLKRTPDEAQTLERAAPHDEETTLSEQAGKVLRDVRELGSIAAGKVERTIGGVKERGRHAFDRGRARARGVQGDFERLVGDHPFGTMLVAVGVGVLLGITLRRRKAPAEATDAAR